MLDGHRVVRVSFSREDRQMRDTAVCLSSRGYAFVATRPAKERKTLCNARPAATIWWRHLYISAVVIGARSCTLPFRNISTNIKICISNQILQCHRWFCLNAIGCIFHFTKCDMNFLRNFWISIEYFEYLWTVVYLSTTFVSVPSISAMRTRRTGARSYSTLAKRFAERSFRKSWEFMKPRTLEIRRIWFMRDAFWKRACLKFKGRRGFTDLRPASALRFYECLVECLWEAYS